MFQTDLKQAWRTLRNSPVFAVTAIATLALGIGSSTAIFSVTSAVLLQPLPYNNPDRLVVARAGMRKRGVRDFPFSHADFIDLRDGASGMFESFAAVYTDRELLTSAKGADARQQSRKELRSSWGGALNSAAVLRGFLTRQDGAPEEVQFAWVTPNFFRMLGGKIAFGRDFLETDGAPQPSQPQSVNSPGNQTPQTLPTIAILSYGYFKRRYGGDLSTFRKSILGHPMALAGGGGPQIAGVLAPGFELFFPPDADVERAPDIWIASRLTYDNAQRNTVSLRVVGLLKRGVTLDRAQAQVDNVAAQLRRNFPIHRTSGFFIELEPMKKHLVAEVQPAIVALFGAVIFLLLIACANVANLMLVRASVRERELAIRVALGGSWWRLVRQTLTEALVLAALGTVFGVSLAWLGIRELLVIAPTDIPRLESTAINPGVLLFAALAGLASAVIFGLAPALRAASADIMHILRASGRSPNLGSAPLRNGVIVAEVALSFVLLIGSGLMLRSFLALRHIDPGYDPRNLLTFQILGAGAPEADRRAAIMRDLHDRLSAIPGVQSVTAASPFPLTGNFYPIRWGTAEALVDPSRFQAADFQMVLPGYFKTLDIPLLSGRLFTNADNAPDRNLAIVDQVLASKAFPNQAAVGKRILIRLRTPEPEWVEIIGVVAHQRNSSLADPGREEIFFTDGFGGHSAADRWAVRTTGAPAKYADPIRREVAMINPQLLVAHTEPMTTLVERAQAGTRFSLLLIGLFGTISAVLAGVGIYGVLASFVRQRTAEIGVRMALGAQPSSIFSLVVGSGLRLSMIGILIGAAAALGLTRLMKSMLIGIKASDPPTFLAMAAFFLGIAAVAASLPALRASGLDPTEALREE